MAHPDEAGRRCTTPIREADPRIDVVADPTHARPPWDADANDGGAVGSRRTLVDQTSMAAGTVEH